MDEQSTTPARGHRTFQRRPRRWGALAGSLAVMGSMAGGGAAIAAVGSAPAPAAASGAAAPALGYTAAQDEAFWVAGFTTGDIEALAQLWATDEAGVMARAGQAVLDGEPVPVAPGTFPDLPGEPSGYTWKQYEALWGEGYTAGDVQALVELWATDASGAKSRAGQAVLDGVPVPVAPGTFPDPLTDADPLWTAFTDAGYTYDDAVALAELWGTDSVEAKARAGRAVLDGESLPVAPGSSAHAAG